MKILFPHKQKQEIIPVVVLDKEPDLVPLAPILREPLDIVIDVSYLAYRSAYAYHDLMVQRTLNSSHVVTNKPTGHIYGSVLSILNLHKEFSITHDVCFVFAVDGYPAWRKEAFPEYKAGRVRTIGFDPKEDVISILPNIPGKILSNTQEEADDIIASYVKRESEKNKKMVVISADRDLWVLKDLPNVRIFGNKMEEVSTNYIYDSFYTKKSAFISLAKSILGDETDNLPKVLRFPRKDLSIILENTSTPDVDSMIFSAKKLSDSRKIAPRSLSLLLENEIQIRKTFSIAKLRDICFNEEVNNFNRDYLHDVLTNFGCLSLIPRIDSLYRGKNDH